MKILKFLLALVIITMTSLAEAQEWVPIVKSESGTFFILKNSLKLAENHADEKVFLVTGRFTSEKLKTSQFLMWYVTVEHCSKSSGKLVLVDTAGNYIDEVEYKNDDETVVATIARTICVNAFNYYMRSNPRNNI